MPFDNPREKPPYFFQFNDRKHEACMFCGQSFVGPPNQVRCGAEECIRKMHERQREMSKGYHTARRAREKAVAAKAEREKNK